jgi:tetratricopeptide (TPR) repeat protein
MRRGTIIVRLRYSCFEPLQISIIVVRISLAVALFVLAAGTARAQSASDQIALGDAEYTQMNAPSALAHYQKALALDSRSFEALWKASRSAVDIGSYASDESKQTSLFSLAEQFARRALAINPDSPERHFALARALGKTALAQSPRGRVKYATEIRSEALECLKLEPSNGGCLHAM